MPDHSKTFTYELEGLSYTVTVFEDPVTGSVFAEVEVLEGSMDVNAIYYGDDDFSGDSASLDGPLNMNGTRLEGEHIQWDGAVALSDPGLGPDADEKETYLQSGESYLVELTDVSSIDEIDVLGIRATSTTTEEGSIKSVSDEPEDPEDPEDPTFEKIGFGVEIGANGGIANGVYVFEEALPEGQDGTFENYVAYYDSLYAEDPDYNITQLESVIFLELVPGTDDNGNPIDIPQELFRIDAPEDGWNSADDLLASYEEAVANGALDGVSADEGVELIAALSLDGSYDDPAMDGDGMEEDALEFM
ncbi:hypothetical protein [Nioella aestuarii]|uniref:hypothetical protein n=1 Tax=Nioella aestuarii TaxID=1662864 RepID=UPI003D7FCF5D